MKPWALPTRSVSGLSCLSCPFARCLPSLLWLLGSVLVGSEVHVAEGVVVVVPPLLLEACNAGPCRRNGTRKAPIPATIRAIAPTLRFADESILVFPFSLFLELNPRFERAEYMIQRFEQPERCQIDLVAPD